MPAPNKDYRENHSRCVYILGKINQEMVHSLSRRINILRATNSDPITAYVDSTGGYPAAAEAIRCLITAANQDGERCRLIAVVTGTAASAAADFVALADYAIAHSHAEIICHGSRHLLEEELTYEYASFLAANLQETNERLALRLARCLFPRITWRVSQLGDPFNRYRDGNVEADEIIGCLAEKFEPQNKPLLDEALKKQKVITELTHSVRKHLGRFKDVRSMPKCRFQGEILKAIITSRTRLHKSDGWLLSGGGMQDIANDFSLVHDFYYGTQTKDLESFAVYGSLFLTPAQQDKYRALPEAQQKDFVLQHAGQKLKKLWYFVVSLCRLLQTKDYKLTAEEAYWMGVVDEVPGSGLPNDRELIESLPVLPTPTAQQTSAPAVATQGVSGVAAAS